MSWNPNEMLEDTKQKRREALKEQGKAEFLTLEEGVTIMTVDTTVALREMDGDFGKRTIFRVTIGKNVYDLPASYGLAAKILKVMTEDKTNKLQIIRVGEGKQTRYSAKKA